MKHGGGSIMLGDREVNQVRRKEPNNEYDHISCNIALALAANGWSDILDGNLLQSALELTLGQPFIIQQDNRPNYKILTKKKPKMLK